MSIPDTSKARKQPRSDYGTVSERDALLDAKNMEKSRVRAAQKRTPRYAIRAFCVMCMGGDLEAVKTCPDMNCPLRPYRRLGKPQWPDENEPNSG